MSKRARSSTGETKSSARTAASDWRSARRALSRKARAPAPVGARARREAPPEARGRAVPRRGRRGSFWRATRDRLDAPGLDVELGGQYAGDCRSGTVAERLKRARQRFGARLGAELPRETKNGVGRCMFAGSGVALAGGDVSLAESGANAAAKPPHVESPSSGASHSRASPSRRRKARRCGAIGHREVLSAARSSAAIAVAASPLRRLSATRACAATLGSPPSASFQPVEGGAGVARVGKRRSRRRAILLLRSGRPWCRAHRARAGFRQGRAQRVPRVRG